MVGTILGLEVVTKKDLAPTFTDFKFKVETDVKQMFTQLSV